MKWCPTRILEWIRDVFATDNSKRIKKKWECCFVVWSVISATTLYNIAMQAYAFVKNVIKIPALHICTLAFQAWLSPKLCILKSKLSFCWNKSCLYEKYTASKFVPVMLCALYKPVVSSSPPLLMFAFCIWGWEDVGDGAGEDKAASQVFLQKIRLWMTLKIILQTKGWRRSHWDILFRSMKAFSNGKSPMKMLRLSLCFFLMKMNVRAHDFDLKYSLENS